MLKQPIKHFLDEKEKRPEIREARTLFFNKILYPFLVFGLLSTAMGSYQALQQGQWVFSSLYMGSYLIFAITVLPFSRASLFIRSMAMILALVIISVSVLLRIGLSGIGLELLILSCSAASALLGRKFGLGLVGFGGLAALIIGGCMVSGLLEVRETNLLTSLSPLAWGTSVFVFCMVGLGVVIIPQLFLDRLNDSLNLLEERTLHLEESNQALTTEIEARQRAEEDLKKSEEKYRLVVESANSIILRMNGKGDVTFFNDFAQKFFGYSEEEILGHNVLGKIVPLTETTGRDLRLMVEDITRNPNRHVTNENENMCKDGRRVWIAWTNKPTFDDSGAVKEILCVGNDITDRKMAEDEKARLESRLKRAERMEALGTLAGGVAHDLNNILSGIVSYPHLLLLQLPEDSPLIKPIKTIQESGQRAAAIVQDLLTLARRGVGNTEVVDLNRVVSDYLASPEFKEIRTLHPDVKVETRLGKGFLNILASPLHISKTIMNLVSNAAEAMPNGGRILLKTESRYIDQPISGYDDISEGDYAVLTVSDNGIGLSPEEKERIFEPFYTKKKMGRSGTGLGLALVWGSVKDHNGYIDIVSTQGKGTVFTLYFPLTRKERFEEANGSSLDECRGHGEKILVVDDVENQREIACMILEHLGYSAVAVSSGEEALTYLNEHGVDLVVLDMIMEPGMDGLDTYKKIIEFRPAQKAIIASGFSETDRVKEVLSLGVGGYLRKPYDINNLAKMVRDELDK